MMGVAAAAAVAFCTPSADADAVAIADAYVAAWDRGDLAAMRRFLRPDARIVFDERQFTAEGWKPDLRPREASTSRTRLVIDDPAAFRVIDITPSSFAGPTRESRRSVVTEYSVKDGCIVEVRGHMGGILP